MQTARARKEEQNNVCVCKCVRACVQASWSIRVCVSFYGLVYIKHVLEHFVCVCVCVCAQGCVPRLVVAGVPGCVSGF